MADKLRITLVKSPIGAIPKQRATVEALGLRKVNKTVELPDNDAVREMCIRDSHSSWLRKATTRHFVCPPER